MSLNRETYRSSKGYELKNYSLNDKEPYLMDEKSGIKLFTRNHFIIPKTLDLKKIEHKESKSFSKQEIIKQTITENQDKASYFGEVEEGIVVGQIINDKGNVLLLQDGYDDSMQLSQEDRVIWGRLRGLEAHLGAQRPYYLESSFGEDIQAMREVKELDYKKQGSTATRVTIHQGHLQWAYLGDSPIYSIRINKETKAIKIRLLNDPLHNPKKGTPEGDRVEREYKNNPKKSVPPNTDTGYLRTKDEKGKPRDTLALSRTVGDEDIQEKTRLISYEPGFGFDPYEKCGPDEEEFIYIGSDGPIQKKTLTELTQDEQNFLYKIFASDKSLLDKFKLFGKFCTEHLGSFDDIGGFLIDRNAKIFSEVGYAFQITDGHAGYDVSEWMRQRFSESLEAIEIIHNILHNPQWLNEMLATDSPHHHSLKTMIKNLGKDSRKSARELISHFLETPNELDKLADEIKESKSEQSNHSKSALPKTLESLQQLMGEGQQWHFLPEKVSKIFCNCIYKISKMKLIDEASKPRLYECLRASKINSSPLLTLSTNEPKGYWVLTSPKEYEKIMAMDQQFEALLAFEKQIMEQRDQEIKNAQNKRNFVLHFFRGDNSKKFKDDIDGLIQHMYRNLLNNPKNHFLSAFDDYLIRKVKNNELIAILRSIKNKYINLQPDSPIDTIDDQPKKKIYYVMG